MNILSDKKQLFSTGTYLSFLAFILSVSQGWSIGIIVFKVLAIVFLGLFLFDKKIEFKHDFEKSIIASAVLLFQVLILWRGKIDYSFWLNGAFDICCCSLLIIICLIYFFTNNFSFSGESAKNWINVNKNIFLLILCFILLSVEVVDCYFVFDAHAYYKSLISAVNNFNANFSQVYNLYLCGHPSLGYSLWLILFQLIKGGEASAHIADIVLASISIFSYYQILRKLLSRKYSDKALLFAVIPYAFSPFVLGRVGDMNPDTATMYFAVIFIACSLYNYQCLELIAALCFCFTKESAIIYYTVYIFAKILCESVRSNKFNISGILKSSFGNIKNYLYAVPAMLWVVLFKLKSGGGWSGTESISWNSREHNCFGISKNVIVMKLKQGFFLNFNWVFWIVIVTGLIVFIIQRLLFKKKFNGEVIEKTVPLMALIVSVMAFGCLYITWTHPRYIVPMIPMLYLTATVTAGSLKSKKEFFISCNVFLGVVMLIQSFYTVDPVMKKVFSEVPIGNTKLCSLKVKPDDRLSDTADILDGIVYNRQYIYLNKVIMGVLKETEYEGSFLIVRPDGDNCNETAFWGGFEKNYIYDTQKGKLSYDYGKDCVYIKSCTVSEMENAFLANGFSRLLYIVPEWSEPDDSVITGNELFMKNIIKTGEIDERGYKVKYVLFDMNYKQPLKNGNYILSPKQNENLGLKTDGISLYLEDGGELLSVTCKKNEYKFEFMDYSLAMDVMNNDGETGIVWPYESNNTNAQKFKLDKSGDYYIIGWGDYALTYDSDNNSVKLAPKTGNDDQLWLFH